MHTLSRAPNRSRIATLLCLLAALSIVAVLYTIAAHSADAATVASGILSASAFVPVVARTPAQLDAMSKPSGAKSRTFRAPIYDTQLYTSGTTLNLTYFGAIQSDKSLSNMRGNGGTFPAGVYFEPLTMGFDFLADASLAAASTEVGILDDIAKLIHTARGYAEITVGDVTLPQIPLTFLHASGGATGALAGTWTAPNAVQVGQNGVQDGGYCIAGSFILSPNTPFSVKLTFAAAQTLNSGNTQCRVWFDGNWTLPTG